VNFFKDDEEGRTPLHVAAEGGHTDCIQALVEAGALLELKVMTSKVTPLHLAVTYGHQPAYDLLMSSGSDIQAANAFGNTCLHLASVRGHIALMEDILQKGAQVNAQNNLGATPLLMACYSEGEPVDVAGKLVPSGADCNIFDTNNITPVMAAVQQKEVGLVKLFISSGANVSIADRFGKTPLNYAQLGGHEELIKLVSDAMPAADEEGTEDRMGPLAGKRIEDAKAFAEGQDGSTAPPAPSDSVDQPVSPTEPAATPVAAEAAPVAAS